MAETDPARANDACPQCRAPLEPHQSWCLACGAPARTVLAPVPNWRVPLIALGVVILLAAAGLTIALITLAAGPTTTTVFTKATPAPAAGPAATTATTPATPVGATPAGATPAGATPAGVTPTGATPAGATPAVPRAATPTVSTRRATTTPNATNKQR
jgi:hypothetical protein